MKHLSYTETENLLKKNYIKLEDLENYIFPLELLEKYSHKFKERHWQTISQSQLQVLSYDFIDQFCDKVDWHFISVYKPMPESFIEKYDDKIYWKDLCLFQKLSWEFIMKHIDKLDSYRLLANRNISQETKELLKTTVKVSS